MTNATKTSLGEIQLAGDLGGSANALAPELSASGVVAGTYTFPSITVDMKGRVISTSSGDQAAMTAIMPIASSTVAGFASFSPTNFTVNNGTVSLDTATLPLATTTVSGIVKTGANIVNTNGSISIPVATSSTLGVVQTGSNITNTGGTINIPIATSSVLGIASFNANDFTVTNGAVSLVSSNFASLTVQNTWQKTQSYAISALTYAATITPNFSLSNMFTLTPTGNFTLANPTNVVPGTTYLIFVTQDGTGGRTITWGSNFKFAIGGMSTLSTGGRKTDIISVVALTATSLLVTIQAGF